MTPQLPPSQSSDAFQAALKGCRGAVAAVVFFSLCINLLMLTAPLYMLQVFDRVLNSRSTETFGVPHPDRVRRARRARGGRGGAPPDAEPDRRLARPPGLWRAVEGRADQRPRRR